MSEHEPTKTFTCLWCFEAIESTENIFDIFNAITSMRNHDLHCQEHPNVQLIASLEAKIAKLEGD